MHASWLAPFLLSHLPRAPLTPDPFLLPLNPTPPASWLATPSPPLRYSYFDYLRFPYVAMMINQFKDSSEPYTCHNESFTGVLEFYGMQVLSLYIYYYCVSILLVVFCCYCTHHIVIRRS